MNINLVSRPFHRGSCAIRSAKNDHDINHYSGIRHSVASISSSNYKCFNRVWPFRIGRKSDFAPRERLGGSRLVGAVIYYPSDFSCFGLDSFS